MNTLQALKTDGYGTAYSASEVKKYSDKELNDRIAKAKRKAVEKYIRKLGYTDEEALLEALHYEGKKDLLLREKTWMQDQQLMDEELNRCRRRLLMYEQNVAPIFFDFILYQFHDESDTETFKSKLQKFMEDHPQYSKAVSYTHLLRAIGDVRDEVKDGKLIRRVGRIVVDGNTQNMTAQTQNSVATYVSISGLNIFGGIVKCNKLPYTRTWNLSVIPNCVYANERLLIGVSPEYIGCAVGESPAAQAQKFKDFLDAHPLEILYKLKDPIIEDHRTITIRSFPNHTTICTNYEIPPQLHSAFSRNEFVSDYLADELEKHNHDDEYFKKNEDINTGLDISANEGRFNKLQLEGKNVKLIENSYSSKERLTGEYWIDGKPIYRQTVNVKVPKGKTDYRLPLSNYLQGQESIWIDVSNSFRKYSDIAGSSVMPAIQYISANDWTVVYIDGAAQLSIVQGSAQSGTDQPYTLTLRYTKINDAPINQ